MYNDTNTREQQKAKRIVRKALAMGLAVTVADGDGGTALRCSIDPVAIIGCIGEMDMDELIFHRLPRLERAGWMMLVWGNEPDGSELAADYTANEIMEALAAA